MSNGLKKVVRKFGLRSAHITLPNYLVGRVVRVIVPKKSKESIEEITKKL